jgi:hypothetical protein
VALVSFQTKLRGSSKAPNTKSEKKRVHTPNIDVKNIAKSLNISLVLHDGAMEGEGYGRRPQKRCNGEELRTVPLRITQKALARVPATEEKIFSTHIPQFSHLFCNPMQKYHSP